MPAGFDRCVKAGGRVRTKDLGNGKYMHICFLNGKSYAGEVKTKKSENMNESFNCECIKCGYKTTTETHCAEMKCPKCGGQMRRAERPGPGKNSSDNMKMNEVIKPKLMYARPILTESILKNGERKLYITGNAIEAGISRNNVDYRANVLEAAAKSIIGKPLLLNHGDHDVKNIVGKVVEAGFDGVNVPFKAEIDTNEEWLVNKLERGFINKVSIGANPMRNGKMYEPEPDDDGIIRPEGLEFLELSLVPIPGVPNASINQVIAESYKVNKMEKSKIEQIEEELKKMKEENEALRNKLAEEESEEDSEEKKPEPEPKPEPKTDEKTKAEVKELRQQLEKLNESVSKMKEKPKGIVETEESKMNERFGFNRGEVKVEHIEGQPSGITEIYTPDSARENDDPTSNRRWTLY